MGDLGLGPRRLSCACADAGAPRTWQPADPGKRLRGPLALSVAEAAVAYPPAFLGLPARAPCPPSSFATAAVCGRGSCSWLRAAAFECSGGCRVGQGSEHCPCLTHGGGRREEEGLVLRWPPEPGDARGCCWWSPDDSWLSREARSLRAACLLVHSGTEPQIHAEHEDGDPPPAAQGARAAACRVRRAVGERRAPPPSSAKRSSPGPDVSVTSHLAVPARGCDAGFRARSSGPPPAQGPCSARTRGSARGRAERGASPPAPAFLRRGPSSCFPASRAPPVRAGTAPFVPRAPQPCAARRSGSHLRFLTNPPILSLGVSCRQCPRPVGCPHLSSTPPSSLPRLLTGLPASPLTLVKSFLMAAAHVRHEITSLNC